MSRTGKIARLPHQIRTQLNHRLNDGESARPLLDWLNALPEVLKILHRDFGGREINEPNLSDWRNGGYREWLLHQESLAQVDELASNSGELAGASHGRISDHFATVLLSRYAAEYAGWTGANDDEVRRKLRVLRELCRDVVAMRRGDQQAARIDLEHARCEVEREKGEFEMIQRFRDWLKYPKVSEVVAVPESSPDPLNPVFGVSQPESATPPPPPPLNLN